MKNDWLGSQIGGTTGHGNSETVGQEVLERKGASTNELIFRPQAANSQYDKAS
jgi:hypothetical protein